MKLLIHSVIAFCLTCVLAMSAIAQGEVTLEPSKDNTLFESGFGGLSNGSGDFLYVGHTASGLLRRALLFFDVAGAIPAGATIQSVELSLSLSLEPTGDGPRGKTLHRVTADWGEGTSDSGRPGGQGATATADDATWLHTFFDSQLWTTPGGDFVDSPSAALQVDNPTRYTWSSTTETVTDVQSWLDNPASNFGWILIGEEQSTRTARRFNSREYPVVAARPNLRVQFELATDVDDAAELPESVRLYSGYPNPFRQTTTVEYELSEPRNVTLEVYDSLGRLVDTLAEGFHGAGKHVAVLSANDLPAGVYFFRLESGDTTRYRQVVLTR